ncbi:MAG: DUF4956 domain-containing protein [Christensenellaceae bacterium]|jgi:hypothetical protein|nr:DUF4956 domain-containing protein [Christensenellaceae bacterium]
MPSTNEPLGFSDLFKNKVLEGFSLQTQNLTLPNVLITLLCAFVLGLFIFYVYRRTYKGVLYSHSFNISLVMLTLVTAMIILCISSSIGLSLGMVGALSIVRFRTAVKDPMDTVFMFWAIAAGITVGANYLLFAAIGCLVIGALMMLLSLFSRISGENYLLVVHYDDRSAKEVGAMVLKAGSAKLKSKSVTRNGVEATYEMRLAPQRQNLVNALLNIPGVRDATLVAFQNEIA